MDIMSIIDKFEDIIATAKKVPLTSNVVVTEKEAERIIKEAKEQADKIANEKEIVKLSQEKAQKITDDAKDREREIRLGAEDYADEMLANLEVNLGKLLTAVQRGRDRLQGKIEPRS